MLEKVQETGKKIHLHISYLNIKLNKVDISQRKGEYDSECYMGGSNSFSYVPKIVFFTGVILGFIIFF